ncbi:MAG: hypothetical protein WA740_13410, partial [Candidatus Binataceae bacterium]
MKLVTYSDVGATKLGVVKNDGVIDLGKHLAGLPTAMIGLITEWDRVGPRVRELAEKSPSDTPLTSVHLFAPVPRPGKVFAIGLNYADHIKESGQPTP